MIVLIYIGIILAVIIGAFIIELLIAGLYPWVSVPKQPVERKAGVSAGKTIIRSSARKDVTFQVRGTPVSGWFFPPEGATSPAPCIVMAHGLGGTKNMGLDLYAARFQEAGIAVLAFDYRHTGQSGGEPRQLLWIPFQLEDCAGAVSFARSLEGIDLGRIALWGTSLGGGHAMVTAAGDDKIACVAVQCPWLDGHETAEANLANLSLKFIFRMAGHGQRDLVRSWFGLSPHKIPIIGKPGTIALMADMHAWNVLGEMAPDDYINEACARIGIRMDKYRPINHFNRIKCPVLLQAGDQDFALPPSVLKKAEQRLGDLVRVVHYPITHFDFYQGENFEKAVNDQLAFFKEHLLSKP